MEFLAPGVYPISVRPTGRPIQAVSTSTGVLIGEAERGPINTPILITSWADYVRIYAGGLTTPFMEDSDLAFAVYGFFQNGGRRVYIVRLAAPAVIPGLTPPAVRPLKAEAVITPAAGSGTTATTGLRVRARDEGTWANLANLVVGTNNMPDRFDGMRVVITRNTDSDAMPIPPSTTPPPIPTDQWTFNVQVLMNGVEVEFFRDVNNIEGHRSYFQRINSRSNFIEFYGDQPLTVNSTVFPATPTLRLNMAGGHNGITITETHIVGPGSLVLGNSHVLDDLPDRNMIAIPGWYSHNINRGLLDWAARDQRTFPILEMSPDITTQEARDDRRRLGAAPRGALYIPWFYVLDPLSPTGNPRECPPSGHIMGIFARQTIERGVHKAPAGVEADVRGIVDVVNELVMRDSEILNPASVNVVKRRPNYGVVVWGARTIHTDRTLLYVSDQRLNSFIKQSLEEGTQWAVFEPNDHNLWRALRVSCAEFLNFLWHVKGSLFGATAEEAFFVKCDAENNTDETRYQGMVIVDIGYAPVKPAEFVLLRIAHSMRTFE